MKHYRVIKVDHKLIRKQRRALDGMKARVAIKPFKILHKIAFKPINPMKMMKKILPF